MFEAQLTFQVPCENRLLLRSLWLAWYKTQTGFILFHVLLPPRRHWFLWENLFFFFASTRSSLWRRKWHPSPVLLPGKSHEWRSLESCSAWGHWGSDTTEWLRFRFSLSCFGEGNGNPLYCSCLENARDGGSWWAAIYGDSQNRTWLKWHQQQQVFIAAQDFYIVSEQGLLCNCSALAFQSCAFLDVHDRL